MQKRYAYLVGLLGLRVGTPVSHLKLAEALWGDELPRTAMRSLYSDASESGFTACSAGKRLKSRSTVHNARTPCARQRAAMRASSV